MTDPTGVANILRLAIHNDLLLTVLAPFYFIYQGAETLLVIQSVVLGLGAIAIYLLVLKIFSLKTVKSGKEVTTKFGRSEKDGISEGKKILALAFALSYLLYPPLQRANIFDFHAVTLATTFLAFMFYFSYIRKYFWTVVFFILALVSKEQISLTTAFFGLYMIVDRFKEKKFNGIKVRYGISILLISVLWFFLSFWLIIPSFRMEPHFALTRYSDFGDSATEATRGVITKPHLVTRYVFRYEVLRYIFILFAPLSFLSFFAPQFIAIALPEFAINILSSNLAMRMIVYHYTAVLTPFIFIAAIFGVKNLNRRFKFLTIKKMSFVVLVFALLMAYFKGPLPGAKEAYVNPLFTRPSEMRHVETWSDILKDENLTVSTTPKIAPHFTERERFYLFDERYKNSNYIVIWEEEIEKKHYPYNDKIYDVYEGLQRDKAFEKIYDEEEIEIYKKVK